MQNKKQKKIFLKIIEPEILAYLLKPTVGMIEISI